MNFSWCVPCGRMYLRVSDGTCPICGKPMAPPPTAPDDEVEYKGPDATTEGR